MPSEPQQSFNIDEQESGSFTALITGNGGEPLPGSTLATLRLTNYVIKQDGTDQILNNRNQQDVLNANNVQLLETPLPRADGTYYNLIWTVQGGATGDTAIVENALKFERHIQLWEWTWGASGSGKMETVLVVKNLRRVS